MTVAGLFWRRLSAAGVMAGGLAVALAGCGGAAPAAAMVPPAACAEGAPASALTGFLTGYLKEKSVADVVRDAAPGLLGCLRVAQVSGNTEALVFVAPGPAAFAWKEPRDAGWRVVPVVGEERLIYPSGGSVALAAGGRPDVFLINDSGGSGGFADLLHGTLDQSGRLAVRLVEKAIEKDRYDFLEHGLVLHTHRGSDAERMAWTCNACLPVNHQRLLRWNGQRFDVLGERVFSTPDRTANLLVGALVAGKPEEAAQYFASPELVAQVGKALGPSPGAWRPVGDLGPDSPYWRIRTAELRNWDLIPEAYRTSLAPELMSYTYPLERGRSLIRLKMVRLPRGWIVAGLEL